MQRRTKTDAGRDLFRKVIGKMPAPFVYFTHDPELPLGGFSNERKPGGDNRGHVPRGNTGVFWTTPEIMAVFDDLPAAVRKALADAAHPWAPHWAELVSQGWSPAEIVARLEQADRDEGFEREMQLLRREG